MDLLSPLDDQLTQQYSTKQTLPDSKYPREQNIASSVEVMSPVLNEPSSRIHPSDRPYTTDISLHNIWEQFLRSSLSTLNKSQTDNVDVEKLSHLLNNPVPQIIKLITNRKYT